MVSDHLSMADVPKQPEINMPNNVDEMQQLGKGNMDAATESFGVAKGFQAIATEVANYSNPRSLNSTQISARTVTSRSRTSSAANLHEAMLAAQL
jgi:hypothetical protein